VSDLEAKSSTTLFGVDIVRQIEVSYPHAALTWILGEDNWEKITHWKDIDSYAARIFWLVFPRSERLHPRGLLSRRMGTTSAAWAWTDFPPLVEIASHEIRDQLGSGLIKGAKSWIPQEIATDVLGHYTNSTGGRQT
jgi:nicotinic acid mononucleotide adenylyltransferase